jgi:hypothetical protein
MHNSLGLVARALDGGDDSVAKLSVMDIVTDA